MPPCTTEVSTSVAIWFRSSQRITAPSASFTPATSVRKINALAWQATAHAAAHHQRHVARFGVGDAQAVDEFAFLAEPLHGPSEFHAATVDDRDLVPVARQLDHGVGALAQDCGVVERGSADFHDHPHCNPSASFHPYITFMFCTACPAAPLSRLSIQETITRRRPSSARQKPISQKFECN